MIKNIYKIRIILIIIFLIIQQNLTFASTKNDDAFVQYTNEINGEAGFVIDVNSGFCLFEKNPDKKMFPASLTKIMTFLVVYDYTNNLEEEVFFSYNACNKDIDRKSTVIGASPGDKLSVRECLYAILLPSANDVANALAEHVAGSINDFSLLMNEKAEKLGMTNTHFTNPSGLQAENHYTTARDMAKMISYASKNETFLQISSSISYTHKPIRKYKNPNNSNNTMLNTNNLIIRGSKNYYPSTTSGKTGYTKDAGYCLIATSKKDNMHLAVVSLNSKKINDRFDDAKNLFDFYHKYYKSIPIKKYDERFNEEYTNLSIANVDLVKSIKITCDNYSCITLPKAISDPPISSEVHFALKNNPLKNSIGYIDYFYGDKQIGTCEIIGEDLSNEVKINVSNLDIRTLKEQNNKSGVEILERTNYVNEDTPIYIDKIGKLKISKSYHKLFIALFVIIIIAIIISLTYSRIFLSISESINYIYQRFKFRKKSKRNLHKRR